jgi:SpoVK/Ycf46/Vps4 family AAA+-type ATPase
MDAIAHMTNVLRKKLIILNIPVVSIGRFKEKIYIFVKDYEDIYKIKKILTNEEYSIVVFVKG